MVEIFLNIFKNYVYILIKNRGHSIQTFNMKFYFHKMYLTKMNINNNYKLIFKYREMIKYIFN